MEQASPPVAPICRKCGHDLTGLTEDRCPECGQAGAASRAAAAPQAAPSADFSPWARRKDVGAVGAFAQTVGVVARLDRRHLRRWGKLSLADSRHATRFAMVVGLWALFTAALEVSVSRAGPSPVAVLFVVAITFPFPAGILAGALLGQAGVLSRLARRAGRETRLERSPWGADRTYKDPIARDEELKCPQCGYNLAGLPSDRCPECGLSGAVTLARRGRPVEVERNVWPLVAYGTAWAIPYFALYDLTLVARMFGADGPASLMSIITGVAGAGGGLMWVAYHWIAIERLLGKALPLWSVVVILFALVVPIALGVLVLTGYLTVIHALAG